MKNAHFNQLPLHLRKSLIFPEAKVMSSSANEAFRVTYYDLKGCTFEVCYELKSNSIMDIKLIPNHFFNQELEKVLFDC